MKLKIIGIIAPIAIAVLLSGCSQTENGNTVVNANANANHNANTIAPATDVSAELLVTWSSDRPCGVLEQSGSPRSRRGYV